MVKIHIGKPLFEYSEITKYIYIGTNQCCQSHFNMTLLKKGVKADVSLEEIRVDQPFGVEYYLWLPTKDGKAPRFNQLLVGAIFIKNLVGNKIKVYVHCEHGHGRAPTLVAAYFILNGYSVKNSIDLIKKKRPTIHMNKHQILSLEKFEKKIKKK